MLLERFLFLLTGAFVLLCIGVALLLVASNPGKQPDQPVVALAPPVTLPPAPAESPTPTALPPSPPPSERPSPQQTLDEMVGRAPEYANFFKRLREEFPTEYAAALGAFADRRKAAEAAGRNETESVDQYVSEAVSRLRQARGALAAQADTGPLSKVFDMQLKAMRAVAAQDPRMCVSFLYGGADQDFARFAATRRPLVAEMALTVLDAIGNGIAKKIERQPPTEADFKTLESSLKAKGLNQQAIGALLDGKMPDPPLDDAKMCAAGQAYLEALRALPEAARLRIYGLAVELLGRS